MLYFVNHLTGKQVFSVSPDTGFCHNCCSYQAELFTGGIVQPCVRCHSSWLGYQEHCLMRPVLVTSSL